MPLRDLLVIISAHQQETRNISVEMNYEPCFSLNLWFSDYPDKTCEAEIA